MRYGPAIARSVEEHYFARAARFLGVGDPVVPAWHWEDLTNLGFKYDAVIGSGGAIGGRTSGSHGIVDVTTGSAATTFAVANRLDDQGGYPAMFPTGSDGDWYLACRIDVATAPAATGQFGIIMRDPSNGDIDLVLGIKGSQSTTKWCIYGTGSGGVSVLSGTTVAAGFLVLEAYRKGGTTHLFVNEVQEGTSANVFPGGDCGVAFGGSGGTATSAIGSFDWIAAMTTAARETT